MAGSTSPRAIWRKSSFSNVNSGGSDCVEVAHLPNDRIALRDSKHPDGGILTITRAEMTAFLKGVKHNEFGG
jgi:Domain of unknown function (DUF397)